MMRMMLCVVAGSGLLFAPAVATADVRSVHPRPTTILNGSSIRDGQSRLRSHSNRIHDAMGEARRRSRTFRGLADQLELSDLIVYLESGRCGSIHVLSCLSISAGANGFRYLRITIDTEHSQGLIIQQIAHELQHATEIAGARQVVDADGLGVLYRRIGSSSAPNTFETAAAIVIAAAVSAELK